MNTNTLTSGCSAGRLTWHEGFIPACEGGFQGYSRVHGLLPYPEATVPINSFVGNRAILRRIY